MTSRDPVPVKTRDRAMLRVAKRGNLSVRRKTEAFCKRQIKSVAWKKSRGIERELCRSESGIPKEPLTKRSVAAKDEVFPEGKGLRKTKGGAEMGTPGWDIGGKALVHKKKNQKRRTKYVDEFRKKVSTNLRGGERGEQGQEGPLSGKKGMKKKGVKGRRGAKASIRKKAANLLSLRRDRNRAIRGKCPPRVAQETTSSLIFPKRGTSR